LKLVGNGERVIQLPIKIADVENLHMPINRKRRLECLHSKF
jgi:hypothetical protein